MAAWLRNILWAVLVVGVTWSAAVAYWRGSASGPSHTHVLMVMLGLPLLLLGGLWYGRRLLAPAPAASPTSASPAAAAAQPAPSPSAAALSVLASSLRMPHGESAAELLVALEGGKARATLDTELVGDDGYPIMSVHAQAADDADAREQVAAWIERHAGGDGQLHEEQLRALLLGGAVAQELGALAADSCLAPDQSAPPLQLALLAPPNWNTSLRRIALHYLRQAVVDSGWPDSALTALVAEDLSAVLPGGARHAPLTLLLSCVSHVGEYTVNDWSADLSLFSPAHQQGLIPGEGAAGLLLSSAEGAGLVRISGAADVRGSSADSERRPDARLLVNLTARVLQDAGLAPAGVAAVIADTGHRSSRVMELMGVVRDALPHLDAGDDVFSLGGASGTCLDAGVVAALALACEQAGSLGAPVLCIANEDALRRAVLLARPPADRQTDSQSVINS